MRDLKQSEQALRELLAERILVLDGAMGTMLQQRDLTAADFGGPTLEGCNENLVRTRPDVVLDIHRKYFEAGADIVETNSFGGTPLVLAEYAKQFKADPSGWKMLTGDWDQVYDVVTGLKVATRPPRPPADAPAPGGTELTHTTRIIVIDPQLQVRAYLDGQDATADDLIKAARRLAK